MTPTEQRICKNCRFATDAKYRQVICQKKNEFKPETDSCEYFKKNPCGDCPEK